MMKYMLGAYNTTPQFTQESSYIWSDSISQQCPMACSKFSMHSIDDANQDLISNLPAIATEKILKRLPLRMAARMSVLSTKWKDNWLSHRHLVFDAIFLAQHKDLQKIYIVSNILFYHNGPLQEFFLYVPYSEEGTCIHLSPWLSYLSRTCVKKIALLNWSNGLVPLPSHISVCKELVKLRLEYFVLNPPPRDFKGFSNLRSLELHTVECKPDIFGSLIPSFPRLTLLRLEQCIGLDHVIIDVPSLESLVIKAVFNYLSFKNVVRLNNISLYLEKYENPKGNAVVLDSFKDLAIWGSFVSGGVAKSFPLAFNHLNKLCLTELDFGRVDVYHFVFGMVQSCPCIKELEISFTPDRNAVQKKFDCDESDDNYKLAHLLKVKITGITGSLAELKFIEYVLAVSVVLEKLYFKCGYFSAANSELQVLRDLLQLPRASPKAQLVWLKQ